MAVFRITTGDKDNLPPYQIGKYTINIEDFDVEYIFTKDDFTVLPEPPYADPEGDDILKIKILSLNMNGSIELDGIPVQAKQEILISSIEEGKLKYLRNLNEISNYIDYFEYDVADEGSETFGELIGVTLFSVSERRNLPPTIGDNEKEVDYGEALVFTVDMFTTETDPPYSDPEGDEPDKLRIDSLPDSGRIEFQGLPVDAGDIIDFSEIENGNLIYYPFTSSDLSRGTSSDLFEGISTEFEFSISDKGSERFSS